LLKKYHPDINAHSAASSKAASHDDATWKTIQIKEAYEKIIAWWNANGFA
jgi:DnaJ-class molecular chaperone